MPVFVLSCVLYWVDVPHLGLCRGCEDLDFYDVVTHVFSIAALFVIVSLSLCVEGLIFCGLLGRLEYIVSKLYGFLFNRDTGIFHCSELCIR